MRKILVILLGAVITIFIILVVIINSPWFIWHLMPGDADVRVVVDAALTSRALSNQKNINSLSKSFDPLYAYRDLCSQYGFWQQGNQTYALIHPGLLKKAQLIRNLESQGWTITTSGPFIGANKTDQNEFLSVNYPLSKVVRAIWNTGSDVATGSKPIYPILLGSIKKHTIYDLDQSPDVVLTKHNNNLEVTGSIDEGSGGLFRNAPKALVLNENMDNKNLEVSLPSKLLETVSNKEEINKKIAGYFQYNHVKVPFLTYLSKATYIKLHHSDTESYILLINPPKDSIKTIKNLFLENDAYNYPIKHGFLLPDKTLAYEYVPGKQVGVWQRIGGSCEVYKGKISSLFVCQKGDRALIATNDNVGSLMDIPIDLDEWVISGLNTPKGWPQIRAMGVKSFFKISIR